MNTEEMKLILELERIGNITKTSDIIGISQPALSKLLKKIEKKLEVKLFIRLSRSIKITADGEIYLQAFKDILKRLDDAKKEIIAKTSEYPDEVSLSMHPIIAQTIIPKIEQSLEKSDSLKLNYIFNNSREATKAILDHQVDLAIVADAQKYPDLIIKPLWEEYIGLYSKDGSLKNKILYNSNMIFANKFIKQIEFKSKSEINDYNILYSMLKSNNYMGLLPNPVADSENKLVVIKQFKPTMTVSLIYRSDVKRSKAVSEIISTIRKCLKKKN